MSPPVFSNAYLPLCMHARCPWRLLLIDPAPITIAPNLDEGTYQPYKGGRSLSDCIVCPPGMYCPTAGSAMPAGRCREGYYCPYGSKMPDEFACPPSHYCASDNGKTQKKRPSSFCSETNIPLSSRLDRTEVLRPRKRSIHWSLPVVMVSRLRTFVSVTYKHMYLYTCTESVLEKRMCRRREGA